MSDVLRPPVAEVPYGLLGPTPPQPPAPIRFWTGAVTSDGFKVNFDISFAVYSDVETASVVVSKTISTANAVYQAAEIAPTLTFGLSSPYLTAAFTVTGLDPDTVYYATPMVNGVQFPAYRATVRTAPAPGAAKTFTFATGSCTNSASLLLAPWDALAAENPSFMVFTGDIAYPDVSVNNVRVQRDSNTRAFRNMRGVQSMLLTVPWIYMFDDHDSAGNDNNWDTVYSSTATNPQIIANTRQAYKETTPHYPLWDTDKILGQSWDWGRCRFIMPDLRSQRRYLEGGATILGNGTNPPGSYDQLSKVLAEIAGAQADGIKVLFFVSSSTWKPSVFDSWQTQYATEQGIIANAIRDAGVQVWFIHGDCHQCAIDDGTNTDRSTTLTAKYPLVAASALHTSNVFNLLGSMSWNGGSGDISGPVPSSTPPGTGNPTAFAVFSIEDNGGDDVHVQVVFKGAPISGATATVLGGQAAYRDDDAAVTVGFADSSTLYIVDGNAGEVDIRKTWFGPIGGGSVTYTFGSGPTGSLTIKPNSSAASIAIPYVAGAPDTIILSSPVKCSLGAIITKNIQYFTPNAATVTYLAAMTTQPTTQQIYAIDQLIVGLIADGVWLKLVKFWWLGAHAQQPSLLNMKTPADAALVPTHNPVFAPLQGWKGNGVSGTEPEVSYLETGYAIPGAMQNDIAMFVWTLDAMQGQGDMGAASVYISSSWSVDTPMRMRASSNTTDSIPSPTSDFVAGFIGWSRTGSTEYVPYYNGAAQTTVTRSSATPDVASIWVAGYKNVSTPTVQQSSPRRNTFAVVSAGLSDAEVGYLYARIHTFLQAVGTVP